MSSTPAYKTFAAPMQVIDTGLVAPRGICLAPPWLLVADTAQNKIFIYTQQNGQWQPHLQLGLEGNGRQACTAQTLQYPSGIWSNGEQLAVADAWNHRVLLWRRFPQHNYQPADVVLGQPDFNGCQPNMNGLQSPPSAQSLYWPYGVWSNGSELWVADTGNRRILYYDAWPQQNGCAATAVIGQTGFTEKEYNPDNAIWPYAIKIGPNGQLVVADTQYYRCLYWPHWQQALQQSAGTVLGQPDIQGNGQNQYRLLPAAHTLNWCYDACFDGEHLYVADTGNSRILQFTQPLFTNMAATAVLGQPHFEINGEASLNLKQAGQRPQHLYWPFAISHCNGQLAVADTGNSRLVIYSTHTIDI